MTFQQNDEFRFQQREYELAGVAGNPFFNAQMLEMRPPPGNSGCWRGYVAVFGIHESWLVLDALHITLWTNTAEGLRRVEGPLVKGIPPTPHDEHYPHFNNHYYEVRYPPP